LAVSNVEVLEEKPRLLDVSGVKEGEKVVIVTVAQNDHGLEDGDVVVLEDMRGDMEGLNGKTVTVKRVAIFSPVRQHFIAVWISNFFHGSPELLISDYFSSRLRPRLTLAGSPLKLHCNSPQHL
jgi:hypothetical protein